LFDFSYIILILTLVGFVGYLGFKPKSVRINRIKLK
jgi:hypothetical protein